MLATCVLPTASCPGTGCAISSRVILVWDVLFLEGFCFCLVNMSFSDRSDFTFAQGCPATRSSTSHSSSLGCRFVHRELARVFAKSCGGFFKGVLGGFPREGLLLGGCNSVLGSFASQRS